MSDQKVFVAAHGWIEQDSRWLLTKRSAVNDYMPLKWDIPGGAVEYGESADEALRREIAEETGLIVEVGAPLYIYNNMGQFPARQTFQIVFSCRYLGGDIRLDPREHEAWEWHTADSARSLDLIGFLEGFLRTPVSERPFR